MYKRQTVTKMHIS